MKMLASATDLLAPILIETTCNRNSEFVHVNGENKVNLHKTFFTLFAAMLFYSVFLSAERQYLAFCTWLMVYLYQEKVFKKT
jgi:hypothetical protein